MPRAYVLINTDAGAENEVLDALKAIQAVVEAHMVYGVYDIIARVETQTMEDIKNVVSWQIRRLNRVSSTVTTLCI